VKKGKLHQQLLHFLLRTPLQKGKVLSVSHALLERVKKKNHQNMLETQQLGKAASLLGNRQEEALKHKKNRE